MFLKGTHSKLNKEGLRRVNCPRRHSKFVMRYPIYVNTKTRHKDAKRSYILLPSLVFNDEKYIYTRYVTLGIQKEIETELNRLVTTKVLTPIDRNETPVGCDLFWWYRCYRLKWRWAYAKFDRTANGYRVKWKKCTFLQNEMKCLGHRFNKEGDFSNVEKVCYPLTAGDFFL